MSIIVYVERVSGCMEGEHIKRPGIGESRI